MVASATSQMNDRYSDANENSRRRLLPRRMMWWGYPGWTMRGIRMADHIGPSRPVSRPSQDLYGRTHVRDKLRAYGSNPLRCRRIWTGSVSLKLFDGGAEVELEGPGGGVLGVEVPVLVRDGVG